MRIRLDKLFLSAGLALAVIATTIPAIASTTTNTSTTVSGLTLVSDGSAVNLNDPETKATFVSDVIGVTAGTDTSVSGISKVTAISTISGFEKETVNQDSSQFTSEIVTGDKMTKVAGLKVKESKITITETYNFNGYSFETSGVTGTSTQQADADTAKDAAKDAARAKVLTEVKTALDLKNDDTSNPTVSLSEDSVNVTEAGTLTATSVETPAESGKYDGTCTVAANTIFNVNGSVTVTKIYTVETLPSKYTFDLVFSDTGYSTGRDYKLVKDEVLTGGNHEVTYVEGTKVNNGKDLLYSTTDLDSTTNYYLVYNLVSSSGNLFFGDDEDGEDSLTQDIKVTDTVNLTVESTNATPDEIEAFKAVADEIGATVAGYFDASLSNGAKYTDSEVTIKIVKPRDIEALAGEGKTIKYTVIRSHEGMPIEALETNSDGEYITFSSKYFSTYALAYEIVDAADTTEETNNETNNETESATEAGTETTTAGGTSTTSKTSSSGTADNSMMPLFMTTLLLALCAGSLAIYKEKKTN